MSLLSASEWQLTRCFLMVRIALFFFVIPVARSLLPRHLLEPHDPKVDSLLGSLASNLDVFDS